MKWTGTFIEGHGKGFGVKSRGSDFTESQICVGGP